jgi:hypothetical protein
MQSLTRQQAFCGLTEVGLQGEHEICTWRRLWDFHPPGLHPDAGRMQFDGPDRLVETGVHGDYLEIWDRLRDSTGRQAVLELAAPDRAGTTVLLLVAGVYMMRVQSRHTPWPADTKCSDTLNEVTLRHPALAPALMQFEVSFGRLQHARWAIERSTLPAYEGKELECAISRISASEAVARGQYGHTHWKILEWYVANADPDRI